MLVPEDYQSNSSRTTTRDMPFNKFFSSALVISMIIGLVTIFALSVTTLVKINSKFNKIEENRVDRIFDAKSLQQSSESSFGGAIRIEEVMSYLNELQRIATASDGTRAINTAGFNNTVEYISNYLTANTNYKVTKTLFPVLTTNLAQSPIFISSINGTRTNHTYSRDVEVSEFYEMSYTKSTTTTNYLPLAVIPNLGCSDNDWRNTSPSPAGRVALVKRGDCSFSEKSALASQYKAAALLIYNDGTTPDRISPISGTLDENNTLPALFLSYTVGQSLVTAAQQRPGTVTVSMNIRRLYESPVEAANVCADTPTGDPTQTIVIGSHTDSVTTGPGINDNGSGTAANLALAVTLSRLFRTSTYPKYKYRIRFCWWGAEEVGLRGSMHHVRVAKNATMIGERLSDYLINLNYDMLASPNYFFGIYDGRTARNDTPSQALPGSNKITALFKDWFISQKLPWDYTDFSGRSDYGPFLAEGIVAGGLFSGGDDVKTQEERDRYDQLLGQGAGGVPDIMRDPCYHKACDSIQNINVFAFEKMIHAAAYVLEYLGRQDDLKGWLYPSMNNQHVMVQSKQQRSRKNTSINDYFQLPYF